MTSPCCKASGFSFVVMGDNRPILPLAWGGAMPSVFQTIIKEINLLNPAFVIELGDLVNMPTVEEFKNYARIIEKLNAPLYLVMGNHDANLALWAEILKQKLYYSFDHQNSHFIVLNPYLISNDEAKACNGRISETQFEWLVEDLKTHKHDDHIFVFLHEPLYPVCSHIGSSLDVFPDERDKLAELLKNYNATVFCAHEHLYDKGSYNGLTQIITAGAGAPFHRNDSFFHYLYVTVKGKDMTVAVIKAGNILDADFVQEELTEEAIKGIIPCYRIRKQIDIDGNLNDWNGVIPLELSSTEYLYPRGYEKSIWKGPDDLSAKVYLGWDKKNFYLGVEVRDNIFKNGNNGNNLWNGDSIQFAFDTLRDNAQPGKGYGNQNDYEYGIALTKLGQQMWCWKSFFKSGTGLQKDIFYAVKEDAGHIFYEVAMPLEKLAPLSAKNGSMFKFNLVVFDDDFGKGASKWLALSPGLTLRKEPFLFPDVMFVEREE